MPRRDDDDGYGQVDGDESPPFLLAPGQPGSPFAATFGAQPWLRGAQPPWHMWGNTETFHISAGTPEQINLIQGRQLARVAYKRPETWQWLFLARLIQGPVAGVGGSYEMRIDFDVTVGIGRSSVTMPSFDRLQWTWTGAVGPAPTAFPIWTTSTISPPPLYAFVDGAPDPAGQATRVIDKLVAQDIQVSVRVQFTAIDEPTGPGIADVEVSAYFAPKTHVRPDWYMNAVPESTFPGDEIGGR